MVTENRLIAEFMGYEFLDGEFRIPHSDKTTNSNFSEWCSTYGDIDGMFSVGYLLAPSNLMFHSDWNWLMEVVEKIESLGYRTLTENECFMITKNKLSSFDVRSKDDYSTLFSDNYEINHYGGSKKENVYNACVEFIKWYNEQK